MFINYIYTYLIWAYPGPIFFWRYTWDIQTNCFFCFCVCVFEMVSVPPMKMAQKMIMMIYPWIECVSLISDTPRWVWVNLGIKSHVSD